MLDMVCEQCDDLKTTTALLCKNHLTTGINNDIKKYIRCTRCDEKIKMKLFREYYNLEHWGILHWHRKLQNIKTEINDKSVNAYINKHSIGYIRYVGHCLSYGHKPSDICLKAEAEREIIKTIQKKKKRTFGDDEIDLTIVSYKFFCNIFLKTFDDEKAQFMKKTLFEILFL